MNIVAPTNIEMEIEEEEDYETQKIQKLVNMVHSMFKSVQFEGILGLRTILAQNDLQGNFSFL